MAKNLVIVESPTKARILKKILGRGYAVESSGGHIRDLPEKKTHLSPSQRKLPYSDIGVDVEHEFKPLYISTPAKKKIISKLKSQVDDGTVLFLATDEDREGEAIAWHLNEILNPDHDHQVFRVVFHEITPHAIKEAFLQPRTLDMNRVDAQQARRILDRLVGYKLSPLIWKKVRFGLSAGRVQSAAVRMIVDREREIEAFKPEEYWSIAALLRKDNVEFEAVHGGKRGGEAGAITSREAAEAVLARIKDRDLTVSGLEKREIRKNPAPPFITSTLQQEASRKLGFPVGKTMRLAQRLYEGVDLKDDGGPTGLITYMRTDSVNLSTTALADANRVLGNLYGPAYQLPSARIFQTKSKTAQEAHEAIRPTEIARRPDTLSGVLDPELFRLYDLIWKRMLASQAPQAVLESVGADLEAGGVVFRATGQTVVFPGFMRIYEEGSDQPEKPAEAGVRILPPLEKGETLHPSEIRPRQHFTKPPPRYTEAGLVRKMEEEGIGRPSTYAPTVSTVIARGYVRMQNKVLFPTDTAYVVNDFLAKHFEYIVDLKFTAGMEDGLDAIATGEKKHVPFLRDFYGPFAERLAEKDKTVSKQDVISEPTDQVCEMCGKPMVKKLGRMGKFLSCSGYPECKNAKPIEGDGDDELAPLQEKYKDLKCTDCGAPMAVKRSRFGVFLSCSTYPKCKKTQNIVKSSGVKCPSCGNGELVEKRWRFGMFWGCASYPACDYVSRIKPLRGPEEGKRGFYAQRGEEEVFITFDPEEYEKTRRIMAERKAGKKQKQEAEQATSKEE